MTRGLETGTRIGIPPHARTWRREHSWSAPYPRALEERWRPWRSASSGASTKSSAKADPRPSTRSALSDLVGHAGAGSDLADLKGSVASFLAPFPDLAANVRHLVQEGDLVSVWLSYTATHQSEFAGVPASGRRVKFAAWDLIRVQDGNIVEITQYCDLFTIMSQIGALPTAAPA